jgi:2'-5' RNA ligase
VLVPDAEPLVADFRSRFDRSASRGMPAHITVLYPFLHPDSLSPERVSELRALFLGYRRFRFSLGGVCGFPDVVYLAPEPLAPFDALTNGAAARFPETPPYGGAFANPVPHLTIAQRPPAPSLAEVTDRFVVAVGARLPLECAADEVALAIKRAGRWSIGPRFALG